MCQTPTFPKTIHGARSSMSSRTGISNTDRDFQYEDSSREDTAEVTPDRAVQQAFNRLSAQYPDAKVHINASDTLRRALGTESLPAFTISDKELPLEAR
jgi:hypothetical protein